MKKVIFLNAPPRAGKDAIGGAINKIYRDSKLFKFSDMLKDTSHTLIGFGHSPADFFEDCKDKPNDNFPTNPETGIPYSPREWYIFVSEQMIKPSLDNQFLGASLVTKILKDPAANGKLIVITDSGFGSEACPLVARFGVENCLLVHIHRDGYDFKKDSRDFWSMEGMDLISVRNNEIGGVALASIARGLLTKCGAEGYGE